MHTITQDCTACEAHQDAQVALECQDHTVFRKLNDALDYEAIRELEDKAQEAWEQAQVDSALEELGSRNWNISI
ncbi:MAG: hypothetical protein M3P98_04405 [bacterium]|nr:hypothetical protein [bacterium]